MNAEAVIEFVLEKPILSKQQREVIQELDSTKRCGLMSHPEHFRCVRYIEKYSEWMALYSDTPADQLAEMVREVVND